MAGLCKATSYGLGRLGVKPQLGQNLLHPSIPVPKSMSPLYIGYWDSFLRVKWMGHGVDHPLP